MTEFICSPGKHRRLDRNLFSICFKKIIIIKFNPLHVDFPRIETEFIQRNLFRNNCTKGVCVIFYTFVYFLFFVKAYYGL